MQELNVNADRPGSFFWDADREAERIENYTRQMRDRHEARTKSDPFELKCAAAGKAASENAGREFDDEIRLARESTRAETDAARAARDAITSEIAATQAQHADGLARRDALGKCGTFDALPEMMEISATLASLEVRRENLEKLRVVAQARAAKAQERDFYYSPGNSEQLAKIREGRMKDAYTRAVQELVPACMQALNALREPL